MSDQAFHNGEKVTTQTLFDAVQNGLSNDASPVAAMTLASYIMGRVMQHIAKVRALDDNTATALEHTRLNQEHSELDGIISKTFFTMPSHLRFSTARQGPVIAQFIMTLHAASISLHLTAMEHRAMPQNRDPKAVSVHQRRCRNSAEEIVLSVELQAHVDPALVSAIRYAFC